MSPQQIANRAKPATVEVIAVFDTHGTVPRAELNVDRLKLELEHQRGFFDNQHDLAVKVFDILLSDPGSYFREGEKVEFNKEVASLGSGFIVTPNGHVLTNAHVVKPDSDDLKTAVQESLLALVKGDTESVQKSFSEVTGGQIDDERLEHLIKALAEFYVRNMDLENKEKVGILMPSEPGNSSAPNEPVRCEILKVGEPTPGRDVAVLKIEGSDLPTLPLAPAGGEGIQTGSDLLVDGYPGDVALNTSYTFRSRLQPSLTRGLVSGTKEMADGWQVIQTDASVNHGNSGGPAMNDLGEVVGLATFKEKDTQGINFAISIDVARQFLDSLNIKPEQSTFSRDYNRALMEYDRPGHGDALAQFSDLHNRYAEVGTVSEFVRQLSRENAASGGGLQRSGGFPVGLVLIGVVILAGVLVLVIATGRR
ncbi:S1C family serine protease [Granulicella arctica]|uniref:S1C family serine protease n=1 Tax=Granulicella arctica TaxID=940613 RepID=UPI0021E0999D|nr:trypsin-like peptidase domain-containing protein [Granulicella arctica]